MRQMGDYPPYHSSQSLSGDPFPLIVAERREKVNANKIKAKALLHKAEQTLLRTKRSQTPKLNKFQNHIPIRRHNSPKWQISNIKIEGYQVKTLRSPRIHTLLRTRTLTVPRWDPQRLPSSPFVINYPLDIFWGRCPRTCFSPEDHTLI